MSQTGSIQLELPNFVSLLEKIFKGSSWAEHLVAWENIIFSMIVGGLIILLGCSVARKIKMIPGRLQTLVEIIVGGLDEFICGIMGHQGRKYTPFIGTLFIYILFMNLIGLIPFFKSATSSWSITLALALCVFIYVQYTAFRKLGFLGYIDLLMEKPRGFLAVSIIFPLLMFFLHVVSELVKPITLSLRLRSNIWGDDMLLAVLSGFGIQGLPLLVFSSFIVIIAAVVQAVVFSLLTTIYFAFILLEHDHQPTVKGGQDGL